MTRCRRLAVVLFLSLLASCASSRPASTLHAGVDQPGSPEWGGRMAAAADAFADVDAERGASTRPPAATPAPVLLGGGGGYTGVKAGVFVGAGDLSDSDTGAAAELVFGHELLPFLAIEGSVGFLSTEDDMVEVQAIPIYLQARASLPITVLELYGGVGAGTMYVDVDGTYFDGDAVGVVDESEFAFAGTAFLGAEVGIGNLAVGVEGKYQRAEAIGPGLEVEGTSVMVTGRLPF